MYKNKYIKYKSKYLELKKNIKRNQIGGNKIEKLEVIKSFFDNSIIDMIINKNEYKDNAYFTQNCAFFLNTRNAKIKNTLNKFGGGTNNTGVAFDDLIEKNLLSLINSRNEFNKYILNTINQVTPNTSISLKSPHQYEIKGLTKEFLLLDNYENLNSAMKDYDLLKIIQILIKSYNSEKIFFYYDEKFTFNNNVTYLNTYQIITSDETIISKLIPYTVFVVNDKFLCYVTDVEKNEDDEYIINFIKKNEENQNNLIKESTFENYNLDNFNLDLDNTIDKIISSEPIDVIRKNNLVSIENLLIYSPNNLFIVLDVNEYETFTQIDIMNLFDIKKLKIKCVNNEYFLNTNGKDFSINFKKEYIPEFALVQKINLIIEKFNNNKNVIEERYGNEFVLYLKKFIDSYITYLNSFQKLIQIEFPSTLGLYFNYKSEFENPVNYENLLINTNIYSFSEFDKYKRDSKEQTRILMSSSKKTIMIVGAGPIGLFTALTFREKFNNCNIIVVENRGINLFRKSIYSRFQELMIKPKIIKGTMLEYLLPLIGKNPGEDGDTDIELRILETLLLYLCIKSNIIIHYENKTYNLDNLIRTIKPIMIFNASGKYDLSDSNIITSNPIISNNWIDDNNHISNEFRINCRIEKINKQNNIYKINTREPYFIKYESDKNRYTYCNEDGSPFLNYYIYLKIPDGDDLNKLQVLKINKLIGLRNEKNITIQIINPTIVTQIKELFGELSVNIMNNKMKNFDSLVNIINTQLNLNFDKDNQNLFYDLIFRPFKDSLIFSNVFEVPLYFTAVPSKIIIFNEDITFLYMLIGDSHTKDFFYTGDGTNKWIYMIQDFVKELTDNEITNKFLESKE